MKEKWENRKKERKKDRKVKRKREGERKIDGKNQCWISANS